VFCRRTTCTKKLAENNLLSTQHNALVQAEGGSGVYTTYSNDVNYYWIGGQSNGWISGENFDLTCGNACFHSDNLGVDGDGNNVLTIDNAQKTLAWQTTSGLWSFRTHTLQYGKICEYVLDACTAGEDSRITWEEVAKDSYGTEDCPDGYSGTADRYCSAGLAFQATDTTTCAALVSTSGYSHLADGDIDGSSQYNNLDDAFGWSGFGAVDIDVGVGLLGTSGSDYKKLFILDGVDTTAYTYVHVEFGGT